MAWLSPLTGTADAQKMTADQAEQHEVRAESGNSRLYGGLSPAPQTDDSSFSNTTSPTNECHTLEAFQTCPFGRLTCESRQPDGPLPCHELGQLDLAGCSARYIPPDMDARSYIAGERAALLTAFKETLPSQQAVGALFSTQRNQGSALDQLTTRLDREAERLRAVQLQLAEAAALSQSTSQQLVVLEAARLPHLETRMEEVSNRSLVHTEQLQTMLQAVQDTVAALAAHSSNSVLWPCTAGWSSLSWLLATATGYVQQVLSKADVAAMFLSRRILLDQFTLQAQASCDHACPASAPAVGSACTTFGALLFVAATEAAWHGNLKALDYLVPRRLHPALMPLQMGMKAVRAAVWSAAFILATTQVKQYCYTLAERALTLHPPVSWHVLLPVQAKPLGLSKQVDHAPDAVVQQLARTSRTPHYSNNGE